MAMIRCGFTAQENSRYLEELSVDPVLDFPVCHQLQKTLLILLPASFLLFIGIEKILGWGK
jgi:hypothetical protein